MGANGRWDRMERCGDREKGGDGSRTATADPIDSLGRGLPGDGAEPTTEAWTGVPGKGPEGARYGESTRGTGARADVGRSAVPRTNGPLRHVRGRHVAHSRHHLVSVVVG